MQTKSQIQGLKECYEQQGFPCDIKSAPKDAITFDHLLVVWSNPEKSMIKRVHFYDSNTNRIIGAK